MLCPSILLRRCDCNATADFGHCLGPSLLPLQIPFADVIVDGNKAGKAHAKTFEAFRTGSGVKQGKSLLDTVTSWNLATNNGTPVNVLVSQRAPPALGPGWYVRGWDCSKNVMSMHSSAC